MDSSYTEGPAIDPELPQRWCWVTIEDVADVNPGLDRPKQLGDDDLVSFVPMAAVSEDSPRICAAELRPLSEVWRGYTRFTEGDVLLAKITPSMENGKAAIVRGLANSVGVGSTELHVLRSRGAVLPEWLYYFVHQQSFRSLATSQMKGTAGQLRVPSDYIAGATLPLAPISEQHRIVEAIEAQSSRLDAAVAALKRAQANLERYKASVLQAACEGRLVPTEDELARQEGRDYEHASVLLQRILAERRRKWEEAEWARLVERAKKKVAQERRKAAGRPARLSDLAEEEWREVPEAEYAGYLPKGDRWKAKYEEPVGPDTEGLPALPAGWVWTTLEHIGELARGKSTHRPRNDPHLFGGPYPFIQTGEVRAAEGTITSYETTYSEFGLGQSRLWPRGTLCITIAANIAETALLGFDGCFPDSVVGFLAADGVSVEFIEFFLRTAQRQLENDAPATAQKNINLNTLRQLAIPIAPLGEQLRIVDALERRLSILADLAMSTNNSLMRTDRLRQSILKRAFEGRLVPQDPDDEPASVLLARIRGEAEAEVTPTQDRLPGV